MRNLPCVLTQPPGVRPSGTLEKSALYGGLGATRTAASPVNSPSLTTTRPYCPGGAGATVSFAVAEPALGSSSAWSGGGAGALAGGGGKPSGGRTPASDQSTFTSPSARPLLSKARAFS